MHLVGYSLLAAFMDHQVLISRECVVIMQAVSGNNLGGGKVTKKDVKCYKTSAKKMVTMPRIVDRIRSQDQYRVCSS